MKKLFFITAALCASLFLFQCNYSGKSTAGADAPVETEVVQNEEGQDGIRESMEMEFELTKDPKLGFVPRQRLAMAYEKLYEARKSGRAARTSSLGINWIERGPNDNQIGPTNGNTRGPGSTAVTSGRIRAIWVDLNDPTNKTVWVGSVSGGLWKTTDITAPVPNWAVVNDFFGNLAITSIAQNPANKSIMYFGTGERNNNIDAVRGGGVWKTTNGGATWSLLPGTTNFWNISKIACDAAGNLYVGTNGNGLGLQRSTDGGATWTNITPTTTGGGTRVSEVRISNTGRLHVTLSGRTPSTSGYFFTDNPATVTVAGWTSPVTSFPNVEYNVELSVTGNVLYALPSNASDLTPEIYKSTDGGLNWVATGSSPPGATASEPTINSGQGWYNLAIGADPADPNIVIAGGLNFYRSIDGGTTWSQITRWVGTELQYAHADHHGVVWTGNQILVATDGGVFYSTDYGNSWADRNIGLRTKQFYACAIHPTSTNYFLGGTQDNGTHQFSLPGLGKSIEVFGGDGGFCHIDENEPQFQWGSTTRSNYRRSVNGGSNWSSVNYSSSIGQFINPTDYDDINNIMYTSAGAGQYVRWNDPQSGSSFTPVSVSSVTGGTIRSLKVSNFTNNRVYMGASDGAIIRVDNAHTSIPSVTNIRGSVMPSAVVSSINNGTSDNFLIATYSNFGVQHVFVSTTGGGAGGWTDVTGNLPDIPVRWGMFYPEDNTRAIIATDMGVFETTNLNGAATVWTINPTLPTVKTNMLQYRPSDRTLLAATHGRGFWTATLPATAPFIRFASSYTYAGYREVGSTITGCQPYRDYTINMSIGSAPAGDATVQLTVANGTAQEGVDFDVTTNGSFTSPSKTLTFPSGSTATRSFTLRIYNDVQMEDPESFTVSYAVSGTTNAQATPGGQTMTFRIDDNDAEPVPSTFSGQYNLGSYDSDLSTSSPFRSSRSKFRIQYLFTAAEMTAAGVLGAGNITSMTINVVSKVSTRPYNGFTISMANSTAGNLNTGFQSGTFTEVFSGNYTSVSGANTFNFSTPFVWNGTSNVLINICFDNGALSDLNNDLVQGTGNVSSSTFYVSTFSDATSGSGCSLGAAFISYSRIVATFSASNGNNIATALNTNRGEFVSSGTGLHHFLQNGVGDVIARIGNASANLGCVTTTISEAGTNWQSFYAGTRSQKVFNINYSGNANATYTVGLYYTVAELGNKTPGALNIAQTSAATAAGANASNSKVLATTVSSFGLGYLFTATVTGPARVLLTDGFVTSVNNVRDRMANFVKLLQNPVRSSIYLDVQNDRRINMAATLFTQKGQVLKTWNLGRAAGNTELPLSGLALPAGTYLLRIDAGDKMQTFKIVKQ
jgi:trimeric autotransporter adhesin